MTVSGPDSAWCSWLQAGGRHSLCCASWRGGRPRAQRARLEPGGRSGPARVRKSNRFVARTRVSRADPSARLTRCLLSVAISDYLDLGRLTIWKSLYARSLPPRVGGNVLPCSCISRRPANASFSSTRLYRPVAGTVWPGLYGCAGMGSPPFMSNRSCLWAGAGREALPFGSCSDRAWSPALRPTLLMRVSRRRKRR